jgi:hypothetical protein
MIERMELTLTDQRALNEVYKEIRLAWATYNRIIENYGAVPPLIALRDDAARHIETLEALSARYAVQLSDADCGESVRRFTTIPQAVAAVMAAARQGAHMRDRPVQGAPETPQVLKLEPIETRQGPALEQVPVKESS